MIKNSIKNTVVLSLEELRNKIIDNHQKAGQVASGRTISSLNIQQTDNGAMLTGRQAFAILETGRKGGKVPRNFYQIIEQWVIDKGIPYSPIPYKRQPSAKWQPKYNAQQRGLMSLTGAISHKIANEGTSLYRSGNTVDIFSTPVQETITELRRKVAGIFKIQIEQI